MDKFPIMQKYIRIIFIFLLAGYLTAVPGANAQEKRNRTKIRINDQSPYPRKWTML